MSSAEGWTCAAGCTNACGETSGTACWGGWKRVEILAKAREAFFALSTVRPGGRPPPAGPPPPPPPPPPLKHPPFFPVGEEGKTAGPRLVERGHADDDRAGVP